MCSEERNECNSCISEILKKIILLQRQDYDLDCFAGCDKPFLGPTPTSICYNTRPIQLYTCCNGTPWTFSYTLSDGTTTGTTDIFRVEALDDCCCTCRLLYTDPTTNQLANTGDFVTIDLGCCGAVRCLDDTFIDLC